MTFYSVAVTVLIVCYRCGDVKARPQDEDNAYAFVQQPASLHSRSHLDEGNSYVDSSHQKYHQLKSAATVAAAIVSTPAPPASATSPLKVARDDTSNFLIDSPENGAATKTRRTQSDGRSSSATAAVAASATTASFNLNRLDGLSAASSFNGFATGDNLPFSSPSLPLPPPPPSFSFPSGRPAFGQFSSSSPFSNGGSNFNNHGGGGGDGNSEAAAYHNVEPIIHKSVYVHVAPQEDHVPKQKVILPKIAPKKNYQIVFIKAPTPPPPSAPVIPPFPPQSDKTLIYVLHPKPEEAPPIHIPAPPQNAPVKPEVYFIKYKSKKEQEDDHSGGGGGGYLHHQRRYGRDGLEEETEADVDEESLDLTDPAAATRSASALSIHDSDSQSPIPADGDGDEGDSEGGQYEGRNNDSSGESSNIVRIYTAKRGGKNAH